MDNKKVLNILKEELSTRAKACRQAKEARDKLVAKLQQIQADPNSTKKLYIKTYYDYTLKDKEMSSLRKDMDAIVEEVKGVLNNQDLTTEQVIAMLFNSDNEPEKQ